MNRRRFFGLALSTAAVGAGDWSLFRTFAAHAADASGFFFRNHDRVVMIGDSITEQHLHTNYVESYVRSRFPAWDLHFRNAGIGGDTSTGGNARTRRDVLSFHPTAVTITFGMNDAGYHYPPDPARLDAYVKGLQGMLDQMKPEHVRVAVLSSSPVEKKENGPALEGYDQTLEQFAAAARGVAQRNGAVFVDQFHPHLAALQRARDENAANRINGGDAVHPGPPGQILMAWAILKGLHAPALVSAAEIDGRRGRAGHTSNCSVHEVRRAQGGVSFVREDRALPWYVPPAARSILHWAPIVPELDEYTLRVTGLPEGRYRISVDGTEIGNASAAELGRGHNLALATEGPIAQQSKAVNDAVFAKNAYYHDRIYRGVVLNNQIPDGQKAAMIEQRTPGMEPLERAIRDALVLKPHRFEVTRA